MMSIMLVSVLGLSVWIMFQSLYHLIRMNPDHFRAFSKRHFFLLAYVYLILIVGFAIIYLTLEIAGIRSIAIDRLPLYNPWESIANTIYFSAITILSVGYGDITPIGVGKLIASIQALIGYLLPSAFLASGLIQSR